VATLTAGTRSRHVDPTSRQRHASRLD